MLKQDLKQYFQSDRPLPKEKKKKSIWIDEK